MNRLSSDPRTVSIEGDKGARRELEKLADRLFAELQTGEKAEWVALSLGLSPVLAVLTVQRLLMIPVVHDKPAQTVGRPYIIELGKKRLMGQSMTITDAQGRHGKLLVQPQEHERLQQASARTASATQDSTRESITEPQTAPDIEATVPPPPGSVGIWLWGRSIASWRDAEEMAGAHLRSLGFSDVVVTQGTGDGGLDAVATGAAAQVKHQTTPTGSPDIQRLFGAAAGFAHRLFYASAYTPRAISEAKRLDVALFVFTHEGVVVPINHTAEAIAPSRPAPVARTAFGTLTFESRQTRALRWAKKIEDAAAVPISDRKRKGARQLAERQQALTLMLHGLEQLRDTDNPLYKQRRKERTLSEAEKTFKEAAKTLRILLR